VTNRYCINGHLNGPNGMICCDDCLTPCEPYLEQVEEEEAQQEAEEELDREECLL